MLYFVQGDYAKAERLFQQAIAIYEKALGPDDPIVAMPLNNLAGLYEAQRDYAKAEPLYDRSLAVREKAFGPDHPEVALALENLASLYRSTNRQKQASESQKRADRIRAIER
jgi:tetratricopeptide (TPR) repeat protein